MEFSELVKRAEAIRAQYVEFEKRRYGRSWTDEELALGFVGDVGDLVKLVQAKNGVRAIPDADSRLEHELADCMWSVIVLAQAYGIDIEKVFIENLDALEAHIAKQEKG